MAFAHGKSTKVFYGSYDLSSYLNSVSLARTADQADTTTFGATYKTSIAGFTDGVISMEGFWDGTAGAIDALLAASLGSATNTIMTISRNAADAVGDQAELVQVKSTSYEVSSSINDVTAISAEVQGDGAIGVGKILHAHEAETSTAAETSVDGGASTTTGGIAHLHVTAASAADTLDVIIEDSANDSDWATIATFTQATAITNEAEVITGTIRRYVRASWTIAGTEPSFTFVVALART